MIQQRNHIYLWKLFVYMYLCVCVCVYIHRMLDVCSRLWRRRRPRSSPWACSEPWRAAWGPPLVGTTHTDIDTLMTSTSQTQCVGRCSVVWWGVPQRSWRRRCPCRRPGPKWPRQPRAPRPLATCPPANTADERPPPGTRWPTRTAAKTTRITISRRAPTSYSMFHFEYNNQHELEQSAIF